MDRVDEYREIVKRVIEEYAAFDPSTGDVEAEVIFDDKRGHYELMYVGWDKHRRVHGCVLHLDIQDGKVWIQHDGTEYGVANDLVEAGIPKEHIVLAFHPPYKRPYTGYAVA